jgi:hypothetical protein
VAAGASAIGAGAGQLFSTLRGAGELFRQLSPQAGKCGIFGC